MRFELRTDEGVRLNSHSDPDSVVKQLNGATDKQLPGIEIYTLSGDDLISIKSPDQWRAWGKQKGILK